MNKLTAVLFCLTLSVSAFAYADTTHTDKTISLLHSPDDGRPCTLFQLEGVSVADPIKPSGWFAVPQTHVGYDEIIAFLVSAKLSGTLVIVTTNGALACGFADVRKVIMN